VKKICLLLRSHTGHDFSQYKETTLLRRLERRMALHQLEQGEDYLRHARTNPAELDALFRDLLIGVTNFFRDPEAFKVLESALIPRLLAGKSAADPVRVWVCGCATGEEAYSIAIVLHEHLSETKQPLKLQVFATDIDHEAIEHARAGVYPANVAAHVSEERLSRYFAHDAQRGTYRIQKSIRDLLVFSEQDVIKDPPFSKLDLVSCRNLLIYLNTDLQRKLIPLFHYALAPGGGLFLGTSESVGDSARLFSAIDRKWKLYVRLPDVPGAARAALPKFVPPLLDARERHTGDAPAHAHGESSTLRQVTERALLAHFAPAAVLVTARGHVLHIFGRTGQFLEPAAGDATMNVLAMAREGLRRELTIALHKAVANKDLVSHRNLRIKANGDHTRADLSVRPVVMDGVATAYLVVLEELPGPVHEDAAAPHGTDSGGRIAELERELRAKDEYLQTTLEEMETTNEELKSTNEEMQSVNEELSTVNAELQDKVADLSRVNNDMNNLLAGTGVATLFVDHQLRITRFTPAATQVINFIQTDIGRPLEHMASNLIGYETLVRDIHGVLETLAVKEAEVQVRTGDWYLMRIRPYRTIDNKIEGAVITLVDINERKKLEDAVRHSEARLSVFINQAYAGVSECDLDGKLLFVNDRLCEMLGYTRDELLRRRLTDITDPEDLSRVRVQLDALSGGGADLQVKKRYVRADGSRLRTRERVSAIRDADGMPTSLLLVSFDEEVNA
jgi:two-component system CheB/CheR fusion protein